MAFNRKFLSLPFLLCLFPWPVLVGGDSPANTPTVLPVATPTPAESGGPTQPGNLETAVVAAVFDGDTIELADGRRVRYIGLNTPERDQPFYGEATEANRQLVEGREVGLETFDQYGRTLAYIWVDGQMVNFTMLRQGFANA